MHSCHRILCVEWISPACHTLANNDGDFFRECSERARSTRRLHSQPGRNPSGPAAGVDLTKRFSRLPYAMPTWPNRSCIDIAHPAILKSWTLFGQLNMTIQEMSEILCSEDYHMLLFARKKTFKNACIWLVDHDTHLSRTWHYACVASPTEESVIPLPVLGLHSVTILKDPRQHLISMEK